MVGQDNFEARAKSALNQIYVEPGIRQRVAATKRRLSLECYGITEVEYAQMVVDQNGKCAICGNEESASHGLTGTRFSLSIDHDHTTGQVWGLLCQKCNRAIGLLGDDADTLIKAAKYLRKDGQ